MDTIQLTDIKQGTPGITPIEGANLYENCVVALHNSCHPAPVTLHVSGLNACDYSLLWEDGFNDQLRRTYNDEQSDDTRLPAYISVVEFSNPKAIFDFKKQ